MPPGPLYHWLCVAHAVCDVLSHAAHIRATQAASSIPVNDWSRAARPEPVPDELRGKLEKQRSLLSAVLQASAADLGTEGAVRKEVRRHQSHPVATKIQSSNLPALHDELALSQAPVEEAIAPPLPAFTRGVSFPILEQNTLTQQPIFHAPTSTQHTPSSNSVMMISEEDPSRERLNRAMAHEASPVTAEVSANDIPSLTETVSSHVPHFPTRTYSLPQLYPTRHLQSSKVPSSRIGRFFHYGGVYMRPSMHIY